MTPSAPVRPQGAYRDVIVHLPYLFAFELKHVGSSAPVPHFGKSRLRIFLYRSYENSRNTTPTSGAFYVFPSLIPHDVIT